MKIRHVHVVALALAGWYLMMPPITGNKVLEHAALSQWQTAASFDSARECDAKKKDFASQSQKLISDASPSVKLLARAESLAQCVDSADARLKGN